MRVDDNSHKSQLLSTLILVWPGLKGVANSELFSGTWVGGGIWDKVGWDEVE